MGRETVVWNLLRALKPKSMLDVGGTGVYGGSESALDEWSYLCVNVDGHQEKLKGNFKHIGPSAC